MSFAVTRLLLYDPVSVQIRVCEWGVCVESEIHKRDEREREREREHNANPGFIKFSKGVVLCIIRC